MPNIRFIAIICCLIVLKLSIGSSTTLLAQTATIQGSVRSVLLNEPLVGAAIRSGNNGVVTDYNGDYKLELPAGASTIEVSYIGYISQTKTVELTASQNLTLNFTLEEKNDLMSEVVVVADVARSRKTPVAFSTVPLEKIQEQVSVQDLPMVLNSTPGVYATQQGGGDGDARVTIRGFNQRNIAIMIDGVPVNDMENGWVYWSNWSGLSEVARSMQVQRGLGASKLALPSVGGTINMLTKGIEAKKSFSIKQQIGTQGFLQTTLTGTTGRMKHGWGFTFTGSYRQQNGFIDNTWSKAWFYFAKLEKQLGKHTLGLSAIGAPQQHAQAGFKQKIAVYSTDWAAKLGVDTSGMAKSTKPIYNNGLKYNLHWGNIQRWKLANGDTILPETETLTEQLNFYHKPQITLKHFFAPHRNFSWSNIAYLSLGNGGGTSNFGTVPTNASGQYDYQKSYNANANPLFWDGVSPRASTIILQASINNHVWYGLLSTFEWKLNELLTFSGGLDGRSYKGIHTAEVYDLLGGDFYNDKTPNYTIDVAGAAIQRKKGDPIRRNYDGLVDWGGAFTQLEYDKGNISAFVNLTGAVTAYQRIDRYQKWDLETDTGWVYQAVGYNPKNWYITTTGDTIKWGNPNLRVSTTPKVIIPGFTAKAGANWNFSERMNAFVNVGYLDKAPPFGNVFSSSNSKYDEFVNEKIIATELGLGYKSANVAVNFNAYNTTWLNKPLIISFEDVDGNSITANVAGLRADHRGVELDAAIEPLKWLKIELLSSVGDWIWNSNAKAVIEATEGLDSTELTTANLNFSAKGVHVGDAAQVQFGGSIRIEPIKKAYITLKGIYYGKNFSDFQPEFLTGPNADRESWQTPNYQLFDLSAGYNFKLGKTMNGRIYGNILNLLNTEYISDASTRDGYEIEKIEVFFGQGRRLNLGVQVNF